MRPRWARIPIALGRKLNVGQAQDNWNPNTSMMAANLPGVEAATDEVAAPHFLKAGTGSVTMTLVARFSPRACSLTAGIRRAARPR